MFAKLSFPSALTFLTALSAAAPSQASPAKRADTLKWDYNGEKVRGVNLGGWFVLEPWITPSLFQPWAKSQTVKDEYTFCQTLGKTEAKKRLQAHWDGWITESDFAQIKAAGLNHVRIPLGYWSVTPLSGEPYVQGAYQKLGQAVAWAEKHGLNVMIDLHGAPGSQNGFDNSGRYGPIRWTQGNTITQTKNALNKIRDDFAGRRAVTAIELVNEPMGPKLNMNTIRQFYADGWGNLKNSHVAIVFHDAFEGVTSWNGWGGGLYNLMLDTHHYEVFDDGSLSMSIGNHIKSACDFGRQMASNNKWTIAGEFTGAITDCAKWLNGLGKGARYDGTLSTDSTRQKHGDCARKYQGSVAGLSPNEKVNRRKFIEAQLDAFEKAKGWIFWTWKTESAPEWDMQDLLANKLFPQPITSRHYPGQCG